ncbi:MAG: hypothetical protein ACLRIS_18845 [Flavonifractor plautii]
MAAELAIYEDFIAAGIPHYTGADSFVRNGAFATCGVNYTDLGAETADLAYQAMTGGMDGLEDYYQVAGGLITVNSETAAALAIDPPSLKAWDRSPPSPPLRTEIKPKPAPARRGAGREERFPCSTSPKPPWSWASSTLWWPWPCS